MEDIICIFCNETSKQAVIEENGYTGRKCPSCGLVFISPRPNFEEIHDMYAQNHSHFVADSYISNEFSKRLNARHTLGLLRKYSSTGCLLEIGSGAGYFLDEARKCDFDVHGIELNKSQAEFIRDHLKIDCEESPLNDNSFGGRKFDIIYHCDVLSHLYDPIAEFHKMNGALKDHGLLVFETGNLADVEARYYRLYDSFQYPHHLFFFGEDTLKKLTDVTGFETTAIYRYSMVPQLLTVNLLRKIRKSKEYRRSHPPALTVGSLGPKRLIRSIRHYTNHVLRYKIGSVMPKQGRPQTLIVVARKK